MKIKNLFAVLMTAIVALAAWGCNEEPDVAPVAKPTIGIMEPEFNAESMEVSVMIAPSTDATAWYWRVMGETRTEDGAYTKEEGAVAKEIKFSVVYGMVYTIEAYAENKGGCSEVATKSYCPLPDGELTIAVGEVTLDAESMVAKVEVFPSKVATTWYWSVAEEQTEATEWTEVDNNGAEKITFAYEWGKRLEFRAYAECGAMRSDVVAKEVYFAPAIPTISVSKPHLDEAAMKVSYDVTPSDDTHHWYYGIYDEGEDASYTTMDGAEPATVTFDVEYGKEYQFIFRAENAILEGEEVIVDFCIIEPVADIAIENLTAFTLDAVITKKEHCVRYVAGALHTSAYDRNIFIEQAQASLNPDPSYPFAIFNSATESATFSEQNLVRNSRLDSDENAGIILLPGTSYTIAVYGGDKDGHYTVTTTEVVVPAATINGSTDIKVEVSDITLTSAKATVTASSTCKVLTGYIDPAVAKGDTSVPFDFEGKSDAEIKAYIVSAVKGVPTIYESPFSYLLSDRLNNDTEYVAYAVAIKDGKIGQVAFTTFKTLRPSLTGEAKILSASIAEQTTHEILTVTLTTDAKADFVRIYAAPASDHASYADNLEYVMDADDYQNYREEYDVVDGVVVADINIYHPAADYYIYASAVDGSGRAGEMVCVAQLAGLDTEYYTTADVMEVENENVDFTGTGTATLNVEIIDTVDDRISAKLTATNFSSNVQTVWLFRYNGMISDIESVLKENLSDYPEYIWGSYKIAKEGIAINYVDGGSSWDPKYEALQEYDDKWGGDVVVMVVLDNEGKMNICSYYAAGREVVAY